MKQYFIAVVLGIILCGIAATGASSQEPNSFMAQVDDISVIVEELPEEGISVALKKNRIQTKAEMELRKAGLNVVGSSSAPPSYLYIPVNIACSDDGYCAYNITVELYQWGSVGEESGFVSTWNDQYVGLVSSGDAGPEIEGKIDYMIEVFLNDFLAASQEFKASKTSFPADDSVNEFAQNMCKYALDGDIESIVGTFHPKVFAAQAEMVGVSIEELKEMLIKAMSEVSVETCEVIDIEIGICSDEVKEAANERQLNVDRCAEVTMKIKMAGENLSEDASTLIHVDGKWYMSII